MNAKGILFAVLAVTTLGGAVYLYIALNKKEEDDANFDGGYDNVNEHQSLLASKNYPFGEFFEDRIGLTIKSKPFYSSRFKVNNK